MQEWIYLIASRLKAIDIRLKAIAISLEAIASSLEAIASRVDAIAIRLKAIAISLEAIARLCGWNKPMCLSKYNILYWSHFLAKLHSTRA